MPEHPSVPSASEIAAPLHIPRVVLLACCGGGIVAHWAAFGSINSIVGAPLFYAVVSLALMVAIGVTLGFGVATLAYVVAEPRRFRTLMPGYWLPISILIEWVALLISKPWQGEPGFTRGGFAFFSAQLVELTILNLLGAAFFIAAALLTREPVRWKAYAWLRAAFYLFSLFDVFLSFAAAESASWFLWSVIRFVRATPLCLGAAYLLLLPFACVQDVRKKVHRDWLHWAGIAVVLTIVLLRIMKGLMRQMM